jgi:hypothetical protein
MRPEVSRSTVMSVSSWAIMGRSSRQAPGCPPRAAARTDPSQVSHGSRVKAGRRVENAAYALARQGQVPLRAVMSSWRQVGRRRVGACCMTAGLAHECSA